MAEKEEIKEENIEDNKEKKEEEFDHLDLSINLRDRPDLNKRMTLEMREERRKKQMKQSALKLYPDKSEKIKENCKKKREEWKKLKERLYPPIKDEDFDHLDLTIDLRQRPDLRKKMTPEMREERRIKQRRQITKKRYYKIKRLIDEFGDEETQN